jgi:signal transduction histidine kinase
MFAAVVALLIGALGLAGVQRSRELTVERRRSEDRAVLAEITAGLAVDVERILADVTEEAHEVGAHGLPPESERFAPADPSAPTGSLTSADRADPSVDSALRRARDSGEPVLALRAGDVEAPGALAIAPVFQSGVDGRQPEATPDRRAQLLGWMVESVNFDELVETRLPDGSVATVRYGAAAWSVGKVRPPDALPEQTIVTADRQLTITAGNPSGVALTAPTIALALATALLAVAGGVAVVAVSRRLREEREEARTRAAQVQLIGDFAPLVQQSLELADVLPSVAVQLSDHFDLAGVSLSTGGGGTGQVELFSFGVRPASGVPVVLRPPERLARGETLALALQRGGRSAAVLQLVAGRDLDRTELQSLRALTELVTAAVVNASLYAGQQQALRRLRDLDALKTVFLGTASHELRTPVTAIGGFASLLTSSWDRFEEEQRRDFVERIGANARSLSAVVQDLLDFSVLDKGTLAVTIEEIDLAPLVESVVSRLSGAFSTHDIAFSAVPAPTIAGNANGLERIVTNLLTNAVKFSPAGTTVSVAVGPAADGYGAELVVSDQGPGIPVEERQRVFSRFFRGTGDAVLQTRGVGIGLSVVAEFVARLRGEIIVDDARGGGARFTVRFPASSDQLLAKEAVRAPTT